MKLMTTAERRGYQQICGDNGYMMVVACDQRGGMRQALAETKVEQDKIDSTTLGVVKSGVVEFLANHCACVLLDAECAVPDIVDNGVLARDTALLIGLDASGYDLDDDGYRRSRLVPGITARRVRALGGTGGKLMVYLRPDQPEANRHNMQIVHDCIADFRGEDLLLVVEILTYQLEGEAQADYSARFPDLISECARMAVEVGAKLLKLPYPGNDAACTRVSKIAGDVPWAVLSAGVDHETFLPQVRSAMRNGASGVIAGRSLWKDCVSLDRTDLRERLSGTALRRLREIQSILDSHAKD